MTPTFLNLPMDWAYGFRPAHLYLSFPPIPEPHWPSLQEDWSAMEAVAAVAL